MSDQGTAQEEGPGLGGWQDQQDQQETLETQLVGVPVTRVSMLTRTTADFTGILMVGNMQKMSLPPSLSWSRYISCMLGRL